ncbi:TonB-dependent siderophore receptor [uncultured Paraglaciecola sp.]|uniref:TonB-dependent receptor plug domain-containing protein n=1 Tax=uncultured Paraglaciecola sp. TaxID=1765024 RepID=UPI00262A5CB1|nr:TonB-dependent receptor plug domain-containing protein [uncultured Paraglaciecola sp.]
MLFHKRFIFLLTYLFYPTGVDASEPADESIEVLTVYEQKSQLSSSYQLLSRQDFVHSAQTLADILQAVNGLQIRQIGGLGNPVSVSIRGSSSKQVQLYIDGQLVNESQFGGFDLNQIPTEQIQSIEISKNQALGSGSTPIGGVIRINTYNPSQDQLKLSLALGSFNHQEVNVVYNKAFAANNLALGGSYLTTDNNYDYLVPQSFTNSNQSSTEPLSNNQFEKKNVYLNNQLFLEHHKIRITAQYNQQQKALPNYQNNTPENSASLASDTWRVGYRHSIDSELTWLDNLEFELYQEDKSEQYLDILADIKRLDAHYDTTKTHAALNTSLVFDSQYGDVAVSPSLEWNKQQFASLSFDRNGPIVCNGISRCDVVAQQVQVLIGSRLQWQQNDGPFSAYSFVTQLQEKNENSPVNQADAPAFYNKHTHHTQELGVVYQGQYVKTELIASKGVRTPTLFELFGDRGLFKGSSELLPEQAKTLSVGTVYHNKFAEMDYSINATVYQQQSDNAIVAIFNSSGVGAYKNVSDAKLLGFEFETKVAVTPKLNFTLQSNIIDSQTRSDIKSFNDKKLPGIYHQQYSLSAHYQINPQWKVQLRSALDKNLYFNRANIFASTNGQAGKPAQRRLIDIKLGYTSGIYGFNLSVNNLFDQQYQDLANRPAQGRNIQFKLSIQGI